MLKYMTKRTATAILTLFCVLVFVFVAARLTGNPFEVMFPDGLTPEQLALLEVEYGLNESLVVQFVKYMGNVLQGDFGSSIIQNRPVTEIFFTYIGETLTLGGYAFLLSVTLGIFLGVVMAIYKDNVLTKIFEQLLSILYAIPGFITAILLILIFSYGLQLLPSQAGDGFEHYIIPVVCLSISPLVRIARYVRSGILDTVSQEYVRTAVAKGVGKWRAVVSHALRNTWIPVLTQISMVITDILMGSLIMEQIFTWPGMGTILVDAVLNRDFPLLQFSVVMMALLVITVNYALDIVYMAVDPRVQAGGADE